MSVVVGDLLPVIAHWLGVSRCIAVDVVVVDDVVCCCRCRLVSVMRKVMS